MAETQHTSVYLYFDKSDILIYVGITGRGMSRQREHNRDKEWWSLTVRQEIEHYLSRSEALARERSLIETHCPPFNTVHNAEAGVRQAYLDLLKGDGVAREPINRRVPLRIVAQSERSIIAVSGMDFAETTKAVMPSGDFDVSVRGARVKDVNVKKVGSALAVLITANGLTEMSNASLMYRNIRYGKDIKRIDIE